MYLRATPRPLQGLGPSLCNWLVNLSTLKQTFSSGASGRGAQLCTWTGCWDKGVLQRTARLLRPSRLSTSPVKHVRRPLLACAAARDGPCELYARYGTHTWLCHRLACSTSPMTMCILQCRRLRRQRRLCFCYMAQYSPEDQLEAVEAELTQVRAALFNVTDLVISSIRLSWKF